METIKTPYYTRTSNPFLSRWQSAVSKVLGDKFRSENPELKSHEINSKVLAHPMMAGTNHHITRLKNNLPLLTLDDVHPYVDQKDADNNFHPLVHTYLSQYYLQQTLEEASKDPDSSINYTTPSPGVVPADFPDTNANIIQWGIAGKVWATSHRPDPSPYYDWSKNIPDGMKKDDFMKTFSVFTIPDDSTIAILGDFGTGLADGIEMLTSIMINQNPDFIIHLGDIYYAGTDEETQAYVEMFTTAFQLAGKKVPVFSIPGNHEYYSGGTPFFKYALAMNAQNGFPQYSQQASYFCLRTESSNWQFLSMDTGLNSVHWYTVGGLTDTYGPWLWFSEWDWCQDKLENFGLSGGGKTVLLSHHQLYSVTSTINDGNQVVFQTGTDAKTFQFLNANLYNTFSDYFGEINAWFWGHEHILAIFQNNELYGSDNEEPLKIARLVGNSGFEEWVGPKGSYGIANTNQHYATPMVEVDTTMVTYFDAVLGLKVSSRFYNHGWALLQLSDADSGIATTYWQYPVKDFLTPIQPVSKIAKPIKVNFSETIY